LEILSFKNILGWKLLFGKIPHGLKPCDLEKGSIVSHRFYFLIAQAFLFFDEKYCVEFLLGFIYDKLHIRFHHWFLTKIKSVSFNWEKKNRAFVSVIGSFQSWHTRTLLYLTLACIEKHCSKVFSFTSLLQVSWVSPNWKFGRWVTRS